LYAQLVIEEKTSGIIEVIISSVKPFQLDARENNRTFSLAGVTQFALFGSFFAFLMFASVDSSGFRY